MNRVLGLAALVAAAITVSACSEQQPAAEIPSPVALSEESVGHYCNMAILEHTGPKAQIHLAGNPHPIWFSQVRDGIAFTRSPEENYEMVVVYVNDMGKASEWDYPGFETWIDAREAWFVIDSRQTGGMGTQEVIPFGTEQAASGFVEENGGQVVQLAEIPDAYVLGPIGLDDDNFGQVTGALQ